MYFNLATQGANLLSCTIKTNIHKNKTTYFNLALWSKITTQTNERAPANASYKILVCFCVGKILCEICVLKLDFRLILGCLLANLHRNWHKKFDLTVWDELPQLKKQLILVWQFVANQQNNLILQSKLHYKTQMIAKTNEEAKSQPSKHSQVFVAR